MNENNDNNNNNNINNNASNESFIFDKFGSMDINVQSLNLLKYDSYSFYSLDNTFTIFKSSSEIFYIIYADINKSLITFNLDVNKKINEIKNAHNEYISNIRYYLDSNIKRDLIMSLSAKDNNLKLWDFKILECILNLKDVNLDGELYSACLLNDNNQNYIITSKYFWINVTYENIKIFDLKGNKIKEINDSDDNTYFIDSYYDEHLSKNYIIAGNEGYTKSYDYSTNTLYFMYVDIDSYGENRSMIINKYEGITELIESNMDGKIRIWNFHSGELLNKIEISENWLYGLILWDDEYILVGCSDKTIKVINLKDLKIIKNIIGYSEFVLTIKKIVHPIYGKCLISQGYGNEGITFIKNIK